MNDIEKAYTTLGLARGASIKEVREAHRDLCLVWDANRFTDNPQMQKKAHDQLARIDGAFETLRAYHSGVPETEGKIAQPPPSEKDSIHPVDKSENSEKGAPSLYEEIFRGKQDGTQRRIPIGWIVAVIMALVVAVIYLGGPADENEGEGSPSAPVSQEPLAIEGPVEKADNGPGDHISSQAQAEGRSDATETRVETASDPIEPAGPPSVSPADTPLPQGSSTVDTVAPVVPVVEPEEPEPGKRPVLERGELNLVDERKEPTGQEVQEDEGSDKAFEILKEKSVLARQLIEGEGVPNLSYQEWKTVRHNPPEFWIDVITHRSSDRGELHLIWSVNTETGVVKPLSQAARDVEPDLLDPG